MRNKYRINIAEYPENAAKKFSFLRLIIYTVISLVLTILLVISVLKEQYQGMGMVFTTIVIVLIAGYTILNIMSIIIKLKSQKK